MLTDEADIVVRAGKGGSGCVSFHAKMGAGPDGGDGGRGGDVYVRATNDIYALARYMSQNFIRGDNGQMGGKNDKSGLAGKDLVIEMPVGTVLIDQKSKEEIGLLKAGETVLLVKGGLGGRGNAFFKSSSNTTPRYAQPGLRGEERIFNVKLKLIADFGLIGLPNAGKSSLLNEITNAQAKIGDYPFTTLEPNLGVLPPRHPDPERTKQAEGEGSKILADIPGLIEGASFGKGLGINFLKHIEKVKLLLHCVSSESEDVVRDYKVVIKELESYNPELLEKKQIILLTKSDLVNKENLDKKIKLLKKLKKEVIPISIHDWDSLQNLTKQL